MGFFSNVWNKVSDSVKDVANSVGTSISKATDFITGKVGDVTSSIGSVVSSTASQAKEVVSTVYTDAKTLVLGAPQRFADAASSIIGAGGGALSDVAGSLTLPLTVGAGVIAIYLLSKN